MDYFYAIYHNEELYARTRVKTDEANTCLVNGKLDSLSANLLRQYRNAMSIPKPHQHKTTILS